MIRWLVAGKNNKTTGECQDSLEGFFFLFYIPYSGYFGLSLWLLWRVFDIIGNDSSPQGKFECQSSRFAKGQSR